VPSFQDSDTLVIGSDYSGESKEEPFVVYSFLLAGNKALMSWEEQRIKLRKQIMPDARRMSYKKLGDRYKREFLLPILKTADELNGLSVSTPLDWRATIDLLMSIETKLKHVIECGFEIMKSPAPARRPTP